MDTNDRFRWRGIAELVGLAGVIGSLVFVGMQLQQDRMLVRVANFSGYSENNIGLGEFIAENRDVWIQGLDGDELSASDRMVFETMTRILETDRMLAYFGAQILGGIDPQAIIDQTAFYMYQYPGLRNAFENHAEQSRYRNTAFDRQQEFTYLEILRDTLNGLETRSPPLPPRDYVLF